MHHLERAGIARRRMARKTTEHSDAVTAAQYERRFARSCRDRVRCGRPDPREGVPQGGSTDPTPTRLAPLTDTALPRPAIRPNDATATLQRQRRLTRSEVDNLVDPVLLHTVPADASNAPR